MELKVKKLTDTAKIPERAHQGDLGYDIFADEDIRIKSGEISIFLDKRGKNKTFGWNKILKRGLKTDKRG